MVVGKDSYRKRFTWETGICAFTQCIRRSTATVSVENKTPRPAWRTGLKAAHLPSSATLHLASWSFIELKSQAHFRPACHRGTFLGCWQVFPGFGSLLGCGIEDIMTRRASYLDITNRPIGEQFQTQGHCPSPAIVACHLGVCWRRLVHKVRPLSTLACGCGCFGE